MARRQQPLGPGSACRRDGWSWYAGDVAITGSFGENVHHDQEAGKSGTIDVKAILTEDEEFLRALSERRNARLWRRPPISAAMWGR
jgi:hypothetical protein